MERRATKSRQRIVRAAVILAGVAGVILIASGVASADVAITVTPNNALVDGQTVIVNGSGWQPGAEIGVCEALHQPVEVGHESHAERTDRRSFRERRLA